MKLSLPLIIKIFNIIIININLILIKYCFISYLQNISDKTDFELLMKVCNFQNLRFSKYFHMCNSINGTTHSNIITHSAGSEKQMIFKHEIKLCILLLITVLGNKYFSNKEGERSITTERAVRSVIWRNAHSYGTPYWFSTQIQTV